MHCTGSATPGQHPTGPRRRGGKTGGVAHGGFRLRYAARLALATLRRALGGGAKCHRDAGGVRGVGGRETSA